MEVLITDDEILLIAETFAKGIVSGMGITGALLYDL